MGGSADASHGVADFRRGLRDRRPGFVGLSGLVRRDLRRVRVAPGHFARGFGPFDSADAIPFVGTLSIAGATAAVTAICGLKTPARTLGSASPGRAAIGSFQELCVLTEVVVVAGITATLVNVVLPTPLVPRTVPLLGACRALILAAGPRGLQSDLSRRTVRSMSEIGELVGFMSDGANGPGQRCRILVVAPHFPPAQHGGGPIRSITAMLNRVPDGFETTVFTRNTDIDCGNLLLTALVNWSNGRLELSSGT